MNEKSFNKIFIKYTEKIYNNCFKKYDTIEKAVKESLKRRALKILTVCADFTSIFNCIIRSEKDNLFKDADYDFYCQNLGKVCVLLDEVISIIGEIVIRVNKK